MTLGKEDNSNRIVCVNDGRSYEIPLGMNLGELAEQAGLLTVRDKDKGTESPVLAALVDHQLKELSFKIILSHEIEFIGIGHPDGRRCYIRSLCFVLQNAVRELFPDKILIVDHSLPSGLYCELKEQVRPDEGALPIYSLRTEEIDALKDRMRELVRKDLPFRKCKAAVPEAVELFRRQHQEDKAELLSSLGKFFCSIYWLDGQADTFHGPLIPSTGLLRTFDLMPFSKGFYIQLPSIDDFSRTMPVRRQSKIAAALEEYSTWTEVMKIRGVGSLNKAIQQGRAVDIINLSEVFLERKYASIADLIFARKGQVKVVFIAGPSSSGKTSSSLRLAIQLRALGMNPKVLELDNYFVDRIHTPRDEKGEYDFESLYAMDLKLLNLQLNALIAGEEVEIPTFDFKKGEKFFSGKKMRLEENDILIMEGIHALNPEMVSEVDNAKVFRVYASALTSLNIDENNNISTSDNRLLRRMVRDNRVRGITPEETILRWHSVRRGEARNIFPYQENSDAILNSAMLYELPMLKYYAEPLLRRINPSSPAYTEAIRLLKFLDYIVALQPGEIEAIPPTSIMREFIGGQTLG